MATIAVLNIGIKAQTRDFSIGIGKVINKIGDLRGILAGIGGAGLVSMGKQAISTTAQLGGMAAKLGMTAEEFSRITYAAKLSGMSMEDLAGSLQKLTVTLANVAMTGDGEAGEALKRLGLQADQLLKAAPAQRAELLADAFAKIPTQSEKLALSMRLFKQDGASMVAMLGKGANELRRMYEEADKFGFTVSQLDVSKAQMLTAISTQLQLRWQAVVRMFAISVAPLFIAIGEIILEWAKSTQAWGKTASDWLGRTVLGMVELARASDLVRAIWHGIIGIFYRFQTAFYDLLSVLAKTASILASMDMTMRAISKFTGFNIAAELAAMGKEFTNVADEAEKKSQSAFKKMADAWKKAWDPKHPLVMSLRNIFADIQRRAEEAARRATEAAKMGGQGAPAQLAKRLEVRPAIAAVEAGTLEAIQAITQAMREKEQDKLEREQVRQLERLNRKMEEQQKFMVQRGF